MENLNGVLDILTKGITEIREAMTVYTWLTTEIKYLPVAGPLSDHVIVVIIEVIRTEDDSSLFLYDIAITKESGTEPRIMTFGIDPCKLEEDDEPDIEESLVESESAENDTEDYYDKYCPDQVSAFTVEEITKMTILNDFFAKMVAVTHYGLNYC